MLTLIRRDYLCSIYNHVQEFVQRLYGTCQRSRQDDSRDNGKTCLPLNLVRTLKLSMMQSALWLFKVLVPCYLIFISEVRRWIRFENNYLMNDFKMGFCLKLHKTNKHVLLRKCSCFSSSHSIAPCYLLLVSKRNKSSLV